MAVKFYRVEGAGDERFMQMAHSLLGKQNAAVWREFPPGMVHLVKFEPLPLEAGRCVAWLDFEICDQGVWGAEAGDFEALEEWLTPPERIGGL